MKKLKKYVVIVFYLFSGTILGRQMIIFDLGGVLLHEAEVNLSGVLPADLDIELVNGKPQRIFNRLFEFINLIFKKDCKKDWLFGSISCHEIVQKIKESVDKPEFDYFFKNVKERNLIKYGAEHILLPGKLMQLTELSREGFEFVKQCKQNGLRLLILSNWDPESFSLIKNKFSELFALFDDHDIIIPAIAGFIKPEREVFDFMIKELGLDSTRTFFVDDSMANVTAAENYGIASVFHRNWHHTKQELIQQGLQIK